MSSVIHVTSVEHFNQLISQGPAVVDFTASWCGPCQMIKPEFERLSQVYTSVQFLKVDVDELNDVASNAGVRAMPTFKIYVDGNNVDELVGASKEKLEELIKKYAQ